jgi:glycosyltransferase involved in cell wall biosynthesis
VRLKALLATPLPPLETGLATYAARILAITGDRVDWTVAFTEGSEPIPGFRCIPISGLDPDGTGLPAHRVFQLGNSTHCSEVFHALRRWGGAGIFHETNFHHILRHMADTTGDWAEYRSHIAYDFGSDSERVARVMGRPAKSREEYDARLRTHALFKRVMSWCTAIACLNNRARSTLIEAGYNGSISLLGHPLDPLPDPMPPAPCSSSPEVVVGVAGGFGYGRGWRHALSVVSALRATHDAVLVAVGAGWPDPGLPWVRVTGRLPEADYQSILRTFNIALDLREGSCGETSGSLLELLRASVPTITSDSGAFTDIPSSAVLRVSTPDLPESAEAAARYLISNPLLMEELSVRGAGYAAEQSDPDSFERSILNLLSESPVTSKGDGGGSCPGL